MTNTKRLDDIKDEASPMEEATTGFVTPKEVQQADMIARQASIIADLQKFAVEAGKKLGIKPEAKKFSVRLGFIRSLDGLDPIMEWKMTDDSFVRINSYGEIMDEQFIVVKMLSGKEEKMHYKDFDVRTSVHPITVEIHGFRTNVEGKVVSFPDPDPIEQPDMKDAGDYMVKVTVKTEKGNHPLEGKDLDIKIKFLN